MRASFVLLIFILTRGAQGAPPDRAGVEFFETKVRPVLAEQCYKCHSATSAKLKAGLRVDSRDGLIKGGESGPAVVPGRPEKSLLIKAVNHDPAGDLEMPPKQKLTAAAIADLTAWVKLGAPWPAEKVAETAAGVDKTAAFLKARREHWAFQELRKPEPPAVGDGGWPKTAIDRFVLAKLEVKGIRPKLPADARTLLRRVYLDLIGLPPTPAEQRAFLADGSPNALEKVVDDLLARPQYGERWGRHWLDVARYAESQGYERDDPKPFAWRYRQYVIDSFNANKPYDRFVTEQLAGDEVEGANAETQTATSFLRLGAFDTIAADGKLARYDQLDDVVGTTTAAFLGQTVRCARCHDHKFEPYAQADYYKLLAVFEPLKGRDSKDLPLVGNDAELADYRRQQEQFDSEAAPVLARGDALRTSIVQPTSSRDPKGSAADRKSELSKFIAIIQKPANLRTKEETEQLPRARRKLDEAAKNLATKEQKVEIERLEKEVAAIDARRPKGNRAYVFAEDASKPAPTRLFVRGDCNKPGPEVAVEIPTVLGGNDVAPPTPTGKTSGRRIWLANYITRGPGKALAARVMANRVWQYHFGVGLVATSNDFGLHGERPTHPELLDYLASELVAGDSAKPWTLKRLHKMIVLSAVYQTSSAHRTHPADPDDGLLWHWRTRRLEAEIVRDSILAVSGKLNLEYGGPSVFPPLAQKVVGDSAGFEWQTSDERQSARRSVYVYVKRNVGVPELDVMGTPDATTSTDRRMVATTALQSLMLLNSRFANEQAAAFAKRVVDVAGQDSEKQVRAAFELALCRPPRAEEFKAAVEYLKAYPVAPAGVKDAAPAPLTSLCLVLLNTNEFVYTN